MAWLLFAFSIMLMIRTVFFSFHETLPRDLLAKAPYMTPSLVASMLSLVS